MLFYFVFVLYLRFCGGLVLDVKRKLPFFASDFYDALHIQSLSAILFIYLGTVTNAITFGGLLGDATDNMQVEKLKVSLAYSYFVVGALTCNVSCAQSELQQKVFS